MVVCPQSAGLAFLQTCTSCVWTVVKYAVVWRACYKRKHCRPQFRSPTAVHSLKTYVFGKYRLYITHKTVTMYHEIYVQETALSLWPATGGKTAD